jgi:hypothetical protein
MIEQERNSGLCHSPAFEGGTMPIRFRRTFKLFPGVKINVSKGGTSISLGTRGATLNFSRRGVRQTVGLPGSGLSETSYLIKNEPKSDKEKDRDNGKSRERDSEDGDPEEEEREVGCFPGGCLLFLVLLAISLYIVAYNLHWIPESFLTDLLAVITQWLRDRGL